MQTLRIALYACLCAGVAFADAAAVPTFTAYNATGIYALGETVGWKVTPPAGAAAVHYTYVVRKNNLDEIGKGAFASDAAAIIETRLDEPGMIYVEIMPDAAGAEPMALGAAVAPEKIRPAIPAPKDFDAF
jgi:cephalosporin-C deacetylase